MGGLTDDLTIREQRAMIADMRAHSEAQQREIDMLRRLVATKQQQVDAKDSQITALRAKLEKRELVVAAYKRNERASS